MRYSVRTRWLLGFLAASVVALGLWWFLSPEASVYSAYRRFGDAESARGRGEIGRPAVATIADDTREVLAAPAHEVLLYQERFPLGAGGRVTREIALPASLASASRLAVIAGVRVDKEWDTLPVSILPVEGDGGARKIKLDFAVDGAEEGKTVPVHVQGFAVPDAPVMTYDTEPVRIPRRAYIETEIGILAPGWGQGPVTFELKACEEQRCESLLKEVVDPSTPEGRTWQFRRIDLGHLSEATRHFVFRTEMAAADSHASSFPVWATPTIFAPTRRPSSDVNVILISIDTLSAKHLTSYGYSHDTAPFVEATFGKKGTVFDRCVAAATTTAPSHMSIFTGVQPCVHGVMTGLEAASPFVTTLAEALRDHGVETGAVTEDGWLGIQHGFGRGFSRYAENKSPNVMAPKGQIYLTFGKAREWLARYRDKRFFLFLHTFQVHDPYVPPEEYRALFAVYDGKAVTGQSPRWMKERADYDREIRYTDDQLRLLFEAIETEGLGEDTVVILTSDHGEEFFEHGNWGHGAHFFDEVARVPLMVWGPRRIAAGRRVSEAVGHVDLTPTILDLMGAPVPAQVVGVSLVNMFSQGGLSGKRADRLFFSEAWPAVAVGPGYKPRKFIRPGFMVHQGQMKLMRFPKQDGTFRYQLYDVGSDPEEKVDLVAKGGEMPSDLRSLLDSYQGECELARMRIAIQREAQAREAPSQVHIGPAEKEKLRALGYLE